MNIPGFVTIASSDYLSLTKRLLGSIFKYHPEAHCVVLVIDAEREILSDFQRSQITVLRPKDLGVGYLEELQERYSCFELCNALRPWLISYLLEHGKFDKIVYLDSDTHLFSPMTHVLNLLDRATFCCCPHVLKPFPDDGNKPDDITLLKFGVYNSGVLGFSRRGKIVELLAYLTSRLRYLCFENPPLLYLDQKVLSVAISLFWNEFALVQCPSYNVAYWNLHERILSIKEGKFFVGEIPLTLFHFSGYVLDEPTTLTKWPYRSTAVEEGVLQQLLQLYAEASMSYSR